jgi:hypothetical protein
VTGQPPRRVGKADRSGMLLPPMATNNRETKAVRRGLAVETATVATRGRGDLAGLVVIVEMGMVETAATGLDLAGLVVIVEMGMGMVEMAATGQDPAGMAVIAAMGMAAMGAADQERAGMAAIVEMGMVEMAIVQWVPQIGVEVGMLTGLIPSRMAEDRHPLPAMMDEINS